MKKIQNLIDNFSGELYNACYDFLQQGEKDSEAFEYVCKNFKEEPKNGTIKATDYFSKEELNNMNHCMEKQ